MAVQLLLKCIVNDKIFCVLSLAIITVISCYKNLGNPLKTLKFSWVSHSKG